MGWINPTAISQLTVAVPISTDMPDKGVDPPRTGRLIMLKETLKYVY